MNPKPYTPKHTHFWCLKSKMPLKTVSKVVCEMWNNSYQVDLALRPTKYGASGLGPPLESKEDFLMVKNHRNDHCTNLSDFALEGTMHFVSSKMLSLISNKHDNFIQTSFSPCLQHLRVRVCAHPTCPILRFT